MSGLKMKATSGGGESFEIPPSGPTPAVLVAVIDLGTHNRTFGGGPGKLTRELYFAWELPGERMSGTNRNHVIARTFTFSFHEKSGLRKMVEQWAGRKYKDDEEFDPEKLLGQPCLLNVAHKETNSGKTVANVDGVMRLSKGQPTPSATVDPIFYVLDRNEEPPAENWLPFLWDSTAGKMVRPSDYVKTSNEWRGLADEPKGGQTRGEGQGDEDEEDIPF